MRVIYFSTATCAPCKAFKPIAQEVSMETGTQVQYVDAQLQKDLASLYSVTSVPTLVGINENGTPMFKHTGLATRAYIKSLFEKTKFGG